MRSTRGDRRSGARGRSGFTVIEFLVSLGIIGVLVALLLPAVQQAREAARRSSCQNALKQVGLALENYHGSSDSFPPGWLGETDGVPDFRGEPGFGWAALLLPQLEQTQLYEQLHFDRPVTAAENAMSVQMNLPTFRCPSDSPPPTWTSEGGTVFATVSYVGVFGDEPVSECEALPIGEPCHGTGIFGHQESAGIKQIVDGTSHTLLVGERRFRFDRSLHATWAGAIPGLAEAATSVVGDVEHAPDDWSEEAGTFGSAHAGGAQFCFADGHVGFVSETIDLRIYRGLGTIAGRELVP